MTETPRPPAADTAQQDRPGPPPPREGWNTDNLRDYRKLRRSRDDRKLAGVAGGLARHLDVDPTIIRVLLVVLVLFGGAGLLLYGAIWLLVPEEHTEEAVIRTGDSTRNALLIGAAVLAGLAAIGDSWNGYGFPWPLAIAALLLAVVLSTRDRRDTGAVPPPPAAAAYPPAPPYAAGDDSTTEVFEQPAWYPPTPPPPPPAPRRHGPRLFGPTLALITLALGVLGLYDVSGGSVQDAAYVALAVAVVGLMLLVGAFYGRPGGLVALGVVGSLLLGAAAIGEPGFSGERDLVVAPSDADDLADSYDVPAGAVELDLTDVEPLSDLDGRTISVDVNAGEIYVVVPEGLGVDLDADIEFGGEILTPDGDRDGWGPSFDGVLSEDAEDRVALDLDLRFGKIEVVQR